MKRQNLINCRKDQDLTQIQLAKKIGISDRHYKSLEAGVVDGSIAVWEKISRLFQKPIDFLIKQEES